MVLYQGTCAKTTFSSFSLRSFLHRTPLRDIQGQRCKGFFNPSSRASYLSASHTQANKPHEGQTLSLVDGIARLMMIILMLLILLLVCCSCGSTKVATQMVRDVRVDTVYLSNVQYDSIYIYKDHASEHHLGTLPPIDSNGKYLNQPMRTDTLYIKDVSIEYRYKLLKDTIRIVERDSIPYEVTIVETKEIQRSLTWYDHFSRAVLWLNIIFALYWLIRLIHKFR